MHLRGIAAGPGFVFTYGPLGFLAQPNIVWLPGAIAGLVYTVAVTFALYLMMYRGLLQWVAPIAALALTTLFALATVRVGSNVGAVPELAIAALILWAASLLQPDLLRTALPAGSPWPSAASSRCSCS